jgi:hypothetical protein
MSGAVIVGSFHDVLGPLFWEFFEGPGEAAHYGLTTDVDRAHRFECDEADADDFLTRVISCNSRLERFGDFGALSQRARISPGEIAEWAATSVWLEVRAPSTLLYLRRFDGRVERSSEWTRELSRAHRFSASTVLLGSVADSVHGHGRLVPVAAARNVTITRRNQPGRWVNDRLEADAAWSEWQLSLRFGLADLKARRRALKHAAMTGWQSAGSECWKSESLFGQSAELRQAFEMGRALFRAVGGNLKIYTENDNVGDGERARSSERLPASSRFQARA